MTKCAVTLKVIGCEHDLETQATLEIIVDRLPSYMRKKWVDKANGKRRGMSAPALKQFKNLLQIELGCLRSNHGKHYIEKLNAASSNTTVPSLTTQQTKKQGTRSKQIDTTTLLTQSASTQLSSKPAASAPTSDKKRKCVFCNKTSHHLSECLRIKKSSLLDCTNFVKRNTFATIVYKSATKLKFVATEPGALNVTDTTNQFMTTPLSRKRATKLRQPHQQPFQARFSHTTSTCEPCQCQCESPTGKRSNCCGVTNWRSTVITRNRGSIQEARNKRTPF